jgi:hypothetical protein
MAGDAHLSVTTALAYPLSRSGNRDARFGVGLVDVAAVSFGQGLARVDNQPRSLTAGPARASPTAGRRPGICGR